MVWLVCGLALRGFSEGERIRTGGRSWLLAGRRAGVVRRVDKHGAIVAEFALNAFRITMRGNGVIKKPQGD